MSDDRYDQARAELAARCPAEGTSWRHASGALVWVLGPAVIEAGTVPAVVYYHDDAEAEDPPWVRPLAEFLDGRFTPEEARR